MKSRFFDLVDALCRELRAGETLLCSFAGERSDFVRFNRARVRQAGTVEQRYVTVRLIRERRQSSVDIALGASGEDLERARAALVDAREVLAQVPDDPWLLVSHNPVSTDTRCVGCLERPEAVVDRTITLARNLDFVGFYAAGSIARGFANSYGQRNWHEIETFSFDWSVYLEADRAVKAAYAGFEWNEREFEKRIAESAERLALLARGPRQLEPGEYRAYLTPNALEELAGLLQWDAFSARAQATRQSALLRMQHGERLSPIVSMAENIAGGVAPPFQSDGYVRPAKVALIENGALVGSLVSPRSAKEYAQEANGANGRESPESLDMAPGTLDVDHVLDALDTGLYVGNLWYLNFSDRANARITGMTRFATFWVEHGRIVAPAKALRFDDTLYRMFGEQLVDLTRTAEFLPSTSTYDERSTSSARLPGALLSSLRFTL